jgi:PadR family transcriptional regulator PadR
MRGRGQGQRRWRHGRRAVRMQEPALLLLLHYGPAHGYTLLEQLDQFGLGDLSPSAVYRALREMEQKEWVTSTWDEERSQGPPRRVYRITALGDEVLALWTQDLAESRRRIGHLLNVYEQYMEESEGEYH